MERSPRPTRRPLRYARRHRLARPVSASRAEWTESVVGCLQRLGWRFSAQKLRECLDDGAHTRNCESCDELHADVTLVASCGLRICPTCARLLSQRRTVLLAGSAHRDTPGAIARVADYTRARLPSILANVAAREERARELVDHWTLLASVWKSERGRAYALRCADRAEKRRSDLRWQFARLSDPRWGWKFLTISPQWRPNDPRADDSTCEGPLSVAGLRKRMRRVRAMYTRVWRQLRLAGATSSLDTIECSDHGHVHLHALVYAPFLVRDHVHRLATDGGRAGRAFIELREAYMGEGDGGVAERRHAAAEAAKYVIKVPSVLGGDWVAGKRRDCAHPQLVANWFVATRSARMLRARGPLRDAIAAERHIPRAIPVPACRRCDAPLSHVPAMHWPVEGVARELGAAWGPSLRVEPGTMMVAKSRLSGTANTGNAGIRPGGWQRNVVVATDP